MEKKIDHQELQKNIITRQLSKVSSIKELENVSLSIKLRLQFLINQDKIVNDRVYFLANLWIPLFLTLNTSISIQKHSLQLIELLINLNIIPLTLKNRLLNIYIKHLDNIYGLKEIFLKDEKKNNYIKQLFNNSLNILLNIKETECFVPNKNYGYSLLNLNGDFLYYDTISKNLLEPELKEKETSNFFDLLIPFSLFQFSKNYDRENRSLIQIFTENNFINAEVISYIIYSKKHMINYKNRLVKKLKRKKKINNTNKYDTQQKIFYKYLKALTSRFSLIKIFYKENIITKIQSEKIKMNFPKLVENSNPGEDNTYFKFAVLMETKLSDVMPNFNFDNMKNDKRIRTFEENVKNYVNLS